MNNDFSKNSNYQNFLNSLKEKNSKEENNVENNESNEESENSENSDESGSESENEQEKSKKPPQKEIPKKQLQFTNPLAPKPNLPKKKLPDDSYNSEEDSGSYSSESESPKMQTKNEPIKKANEPHKPKVHIGFLDDLVKKNEVKKEESSYYSSGSEEEEEKPQKSKKKEEENLTVEEKYHKKVNFSQFNHLLGFSSQEPKRIKEQKILDNAMKQAEIRDNNTYHKKFEVGMFDNDTKYQPKNRANKFVKIDDEELEMRRIERMKEKETTIIKNYKNTEEINEYDFLGPEIEKPTRQPRKMSRERPKKKMAKGKTTTFATLNTNKNELIPGNAKKMTNLDKKLYKYVTNQTMDDSDNNDEENKQIWDPDDPTVYSLRNKSANAKRKKLRQNTEPFKKQTGNELKYLNFNKAITNSSLITKEKINKDDSIGLQKICKKISTTENNLEKIKRKLKQKLVSVSEDKKDDEKAELLNYRGPIDIRNISPYNYEQTEMALERKAELSGYSITKLEKNVYKCKKRDKAFLVQIVRIYNDFLYYLINKSKK